LDENETARRTDEDVNDDGGGGMADHDDDGGNVVDARRRRCNARMMFTIVRPRCRLKMNPHTKIAFEMIQYD
jgi:hypothetical protein